MPPIFVLLYQQRETVLQTVTDFIDSMIKTFKDFCISRPGTVSPYCQFQERDTAEFLDKLETFGLWPAQKLRPCSIQLILAKMRYLGYTSAKCAYCTKNSMTSCARHLDRCGNVNARFAQQAREIDALKRPCLECCKQGDGLRNEGCKHND